MWMSLAGASGELNVKHDLTMLEAKMTREQIAQAQRQARDWSAEHKK